MEKFLALIAVSFGKKATVYAIGKVSFTFFCQYYNSQSTVRPEVEVEVESFLSQQ